MKIAIATVQVPFSTGGAEVLADLLQEQLRKRGHQVDIVTIPFKWYPPETLMNCMIMGRMMDLSEVNGEKIDLVIALKFPAYYLKHDNKVMWLLHQHRQAYDLWGTKFGDIHALPEGEFVRNTIKKNDDRFIREARRIYTISKNCSNRLQQFNGIASTPLYHPPQNHDRFHCKEYGDYIFYPSRIDEIKRQRVLVEAARYLKSHVNIFIAGTGSERETNFLREMVHKNKLEDRVKFLGFISEEEKIDYYSRCLGVYFGAYNEDYGYVTLEAFLSQKPVIVHKDAGGPLEFVINDHNGYVVESNARLVANKIDVWANDKKMVKNMGNNGYKTIIDMNINWDFVIRNIIEY